MDFNTIQNSTLITATLDLLMRKKKPTMFLQEALKINSYSSYYNFKHYNTLISFKKDVIRKYKFSTKY